MLTLAEHDRKNDSGMCIPVVRKFERAYKLLSQPKNNVSSYRSLSMQA